LALNATQERPEQVDRLTTGRRHARAGSVSVTELISRQAARQESPASSRAGTTSTRGLAACSTPDPPVVHEAGPTSHRRPPRRGAQAAKLTSLGVATIVLCGAIGVASQIAHQRKDDTERAVRGAEQISGEQALLPNELNRSLSGDGGRDGAKAVAPPKPAPATKETSAVAAPLPTAPPAAPSTPAAVAPANDLELVRQFYDVLPSDPGAAFDLLAPGLVHSTLGQFLESWSLVRDIEVLDLRQQADGVLAVVRMRLADGGHLQLQQLLTVAETPRRIVDVELLSAQRN
jgi:hypothetical protein